MEIQSSFDKTERIAAAIGKDRDQFASAVQSASLYRLIWVKFKIIDGCNIRCVMCNHWRRDGYRKSALSPKRLLALADELAAMGTRHVNWSGGEPTLRLDLPEVVGRLSDLGIESSVITNGTLMTPEYAERLLTGRVGMIIYSLESSVADLHDQVVGIENAWEKLVGSARYFAAAGSRRPKMFVNTVLTAINTGPGLVEMVRLAHDLGVRGINLSPVYHVHLKPHEQAALVPSRDQVMRFRNEWLPDMRRLGAELNIQIATNGDDDGPEDAAPVETPGSRQHIMGYYQHKDRSCYLPFYHCTIDFNGNVVACCHMREGAGLMGNVQDAPLIDVLSSEAATTLRRRLTTADMPDACGTCAMQIHENEVIDQLLGMAAQVAG